VRLRNVSIKIESENSYLKSKGKAIWKNKPADFELSNIDVLIDFKLSTQKVATLDKPVALPAVKIDKLSFRYNVSEVGFTVNGKENKKWAVEKSKIISELKKKITSSHLISKTNKSFNEDIAKLKFFTDP
jgi:hypothetical protein